MKFDRKLYKSNAKISLKGRFWEALTAALIISLISSAVVSFNSTKITFGSIFERFDSAAVSAGETVPSDSSVSAADLASASDNLTPAPLSLPFSGKISPLALIYTILVANLMCVGSAYYFLQNREGNAYLVNIFRGFKVNYGNNVGVLFIRLLYTVLWSLLLIFPGIIKMYEYSMVPFILSEGNRMSYKQAFKRSRELTKGHKWELFVLDLSFLGWAVLGVITLGIGLIALNPYYRATKAEVYLALKEADTPAQPAAENTTEKITE